MMISLTWRKFKKHQGEDGHMKTTENNLNKKTKEERIMKMSTRL